MISVEMTKQKKFLQERPGNLVKGEEYLLILRGNCLQGPTQELVTFIGYSPCTATVIVLDRQQRKLFCGRESLFIDK